LKQHEIDLDRTNTVLSTLLENRPVGSILEDERRNVLSVNRRRPEIVDVDGASSPAYFVGRDCDNVARELKEIFAGPEAFIQSTNEKQGATASPE
jgi:nitrogen fixation/metabolism regulation signal transduction histidine kinase